MNKRITMVLGVLGLGVALASASASADVGDDVAMLGTSCNNVDITVKNEKSDQIKVTRIGYQIDGRGTLHMEGLTNKEIGKNGASKTWNNQKLQHAPSGSKLVFKVFYKNDKAGGWGSETSQTFNRTGQSCVDGRSYTFTVQ